MKSARVVLSVDIGGTKCAVALARTDGEILARRSEPTRAAERKPEQVLAGLAAMAREAIADAGMAPGDVAGVGVSCGGPLDRERGVILSPPNLPEWKAVPVRAFFEEALGLPVRVENDANATALAEWRFGAGQGARHLVFLTMGTGIGGGIILDGRLVHGANDLAGEIGHQTILMNGPVCGCGKRGCLEALASGPAIARLARDSMMYGRHKRVLALAGGRPADITAAHVVQAAREGDPFACQILEEAGTYMGIGIANVIQILNPERVILGTIAVHAGDLILDPIRAAVAEYAWERSRQVCAIVPAALGDRAQDLAGVALWVED
ncbi:MAG: ROK family protein [Chloroherpetonaceae bacterium]|nr:ROK family protein [Chthonomonadaceae bacterium]MDW8206541.1 ROK family protein [Chloroherpetonaceae bacterium]